MNDYDPKNKWGPPERPPSWKDTEYQAYMAGQVNGKNAANGVYGNPSSYLNSVHNGAFNHGYNKGYQQQFKENNSFGTTLQRNPTNYGNYGGTYRRKNRKTRKTMRKRSYRRRR